VGTTATPPDSSVYYSSVYWNDYPRVVEYISKRCTGDSKIWWVDDFKRRYCAGGQFDRGLFLNCGNGWVERDFIDRGIVRTTTAFDYACDLLEQAERARDGRPITYFQADVNRVDFEENAFDLVVNVGAIHHVQYINRLFRLLCRAMTAEGVLLNYDYVGPARNQYPSSHWRLIKDANRLLPPEVRKDRLKHPHLPTMLHDDPTEAIHSDLTFETMRRYFDLLEKHDVGGGVAYEILTHNEKARRLPDDVIAPHLDRLLALDDEYTATGRVPTLFAYFIARPRKAALDDPVLWEHQSVENERELRAVRLRGTYRARDYLGVLAVDWLSRVVGWLPVRLRRFGGRRLRRLMELRRPPGTSSNGARSS
jgi:SAM-dependent methyltransferase